MDRKAAKAEAVKRFRTSNPEYAKAWNAANRETVLLKSLRSNAKARNRKCTLTLEQLVILLEPMTCSITGLELEWGSGPWAPSIDRLETSKGYSIENVRLVCWAYNVARNVWADADVLKMATALVEKNK